MDYHRKAEIHTSMREDRDQVGLTIAHDWLERTCVRNLRGIQFVSLSEPDECMLQILHAFRHFLTSWVRLSWLWEIDYFLRSRPNSDPIWAAIREIGGGDPILRSGTHIGVNQSAFRKSNTRDTRELVCRCAFRPHQLLDRDLRNAMDTVRVSGDEGDPVHP